MTTILRDEWNFTGYVVSDMGAIENMITQHHYYTDLLETVAGCVNANKYQFHSLRFDRTVARIHDPETITPTVTPSLHF